MKMKKLCIVILGVLLIGCATQQERQRSKALTRIAVAEAISKRHLHIEIRSMLTQRYGSRNVTPDFFIELRGDTLQSYLPYMGQAHQAPMSTTPQGLNFEEPILGLRESHPKSNLTRFEITVRTREDQYFYDIEVYDNGRAFIHVRSQHRDPISFDGDCML